MASNDKKNTPVSKHYSIAFSAGRSLSLRHDKFADTLAPGRFRILFYAHPIVFPVS
jgi:hypothetical protein